MNSAGLLLGGTTGRRVGVLVFLAGVGAAYYVGVLVGLELRIPPATPSVLWPPNAILTAALLVTPTRLWALCLAAALPAHLIAEFQTDWPVALILALFGTNSSEALLAAGGVRLLSDAPARLDTLRRLAVFLVVAVLAAPLLSTFADAAAVTWLRAEPYWSVWRNRLTSNMLAQLVVVPAVVGLVSRIPWQIGRVPRRRRFEAAALAFGLCLTSWLVLQTTSDDAPLLLLSFEAPVIMQLPFVLWAAVRFGSTGTSLAMLVTTLVTWWVGIEVHGSLQGALTSGVTVLALQLVLIVVAVTLLTLATVMAERRQTERTLAERLRFEEVFSRLSAAFVQVPSDRMEAAFATWLAHLGTSLAMDCVRLFRLSHDEDDMAVVGAWVAPGCGPPAAMSVKRDFPWTFGRITEQHAVIVSSRGALPSATVDRISMTEHGYQSMLVLPLIAGDRSLGALAVGCHAERAWPEALVTQLRLVSEVFANAFMRKRTEDALRASELMKSEILESLTSGVAVIDRTGRVGAVNEKWTRLMRESEGPSYPAVHVGDNLLESFRAAADRDNPRLAEAVAGVKTVMDGARERFVFEHVGQSADGSRWWVMVVARLKAPERGAVVTYAEITERRRAEVEAQQSRQELAHVTRVSTMGALAVSLAHQLNQPLAGIMANAQAAQRLLQVARPDVIEVQAILSDIVDDDRRASEVIQRLREMLKKGDAAVGRVDLGAAIRDVATLVHSDAVIRNVAITLDLNGVPLFVRGDRVQLQQAVLNLVVNALEAINDASGGDRTVLVASRRLDGNLAQVTVRDSGAGLEAGAEDVVFEPFYTTKQGGMGMGLSIARSIVEAHGGSIRATNDARRGATIELTLPLESMERA